MLDESSFSDTRGKALDLLGELKNAVSKSGAKVQVDIIGFKRAAYDHDSYDLVSQYSEIEDAFNKQNSGGSNMHAGLLLAQKVLAKDTSIPDARKYMILVSDGDTYLYCKNGDYSTPYSRSFIPVESAKGYAYGGFYDESWYNPSAPNEGNVGRPATSDPALWDAYLQDVAARNKESNGDSYDFVWKYYDGWENATPEQVTADGFKTMPNTPRTASNMDMAFLYASNVYHELAANYHCYSVAVQSLNKADGGHRAFMDYLNGGQTPDFDSIENELIYLLGEGSTVEDVLGYQEGRDGYNFDLTDPESMTITVDDTENGSAETKTYQAEKIGENHYGFRKTDSSTSDGAASGYSYEVTYIPGTKDSDGSYGKDEKLVWKLNVPVTNFEHVSLKYKVKLMNPKTQPGTYGTYDADGSQKADGLYTNTSATLYPVRSDGDKGAAETFSRPTVSYTVAAPTYQITYTDGVENETVFADQVLTAEAGAKTPAFSGTPTRKGYLFKGWTPAVSETVTADAVYTAVWEKQAVSGPSDGGQTKDNGKAQTTKVIPAQKTPATGDTSNVQIYVILLIGAAVAVAVLLAGKHRKSER